MSVTFRPDAPTTGFTATCACGDASTPSPSSDYQESAALVANGTLVAACGDLFCGADRIYLVGTTDFEDAPSVNISNANARMVLEQLGCTDDDLSGIATAQDFLGRVLIASGMSPADLGVPSHEVPSQGGVKLIECGRRPGYLNDTLANLEKVAQFARVNSLNVAWA